MKIFENYFQGFKISLIDISGLFDNKYFSIKLFSKKSFTGFSPRALIFQLFHFLTQKVEKSTQTENKFRCKNFFWFTLENIHPLVITSSYDFPCRFFFFFLRFVLILFIILRSFVVQGDIESLFMKTSSISFSCIKFGLIPCHIINQ